MDLGAWGFPDLHLLEDEEVAAGLGRHTGLTTSPTRDKALLLLTNRRVFSLGRDGRRWHATVAALEEVDAVEMGSAGRNLATLLIGGVGLFAGVVGWFLLPPSPALLPWVTVLLAGAGALLILLALAFPEEAALVVRAGSGQMRLEISDGETAHQMGTLVDLLFTLREARRLQHQAPEDRAPERRALASPWDETPAERPTTPRADAQTPNVRDTSAPWNEAPAGPPAAPKDEHPEASGVVVRPEPQRFLDT